MPVLLFPSPNTVRLALSSGLLPRELATSPLAANHDSQNRVWVRLSQLPARESLQALSRLGVQVLGESDVQLTDFPCWAALLPLQPVAPSAATLVLFTVPDRELARFVGRLQRRSRRAMGIQLHEATLVAWVTAENPPKQVLLEATEADSPIQAFVQQRPGVWVQYGWQHPVAEWLVIPPSSVLLLRPPLQVMPAPDRVPQPQIDDLALPVQPTAATREGRPAPIPVQLMLAPSPAPGEATLWVFDEANETEFWDFCAGANQRILQQLEVAALKHDDGSRLLVRVSSRKRSRVQLPFTQPGYQADPRVPGLWLPVQTMLRPTLRVAELSRLFGITPQSIAWLERSADNTVTVHAVAQAAFQPVASVIDYSPPETVQLSMPVRQELFPLLRCVVDPTTPAAPEPDPPKPPHALPVEPVPPTGRARRFTWLQRTLRKLLARWQSSPPSVALAPSRQRPADSNPSVQRVDRQLASTDALLHGQEWTIRRRELETRLFQEMPQLGPDRRAERWAELASLYVVTGKPTDAAVCWLNAAWEAVEPHREWLERWLQAERQAAKWPEGAMELDRRLEEPARPGLARVLAAYCAWAGTASAPPTEFVRCLPQIHSVLTKHFDDLPLRAAWLATLGMARACDGDALGLARWGDRLLNRLAVRGPGLDLDSPSFLRYYGSGSAEQFQTAREWLLRVHKLAVDWIQDHGGTGRFQREGLDAETDCTTAYAHFLFTWGLGALGERTRAKEWANRARQTLARAPRRPWVVPAVHAILGDLFLHRIHDAIEGRVPKPELPKELQARIDQFNPGTIERYSVDVLREHSTILEPIARIRARPDELKTFWGTDRLADRLIVLLSRSAAADLSREARELLEQCGTHPSTETTPRVTFALLELAPWLDPSILVPLLDLAPQAVDWVEPWLASGRGQPAGPFTDRVTRYQARLIEAACSAGVLLPLSVAQPAMTQLIRRLTALGEGFRPALLQVARSIFRVLRQLKLPDVAEHLVRFLEPLPALARDEVPLTLRLGLATGWFTAGDTDSGRSILDEARDALYLRGQLDIRGRTALALAYAHALGFAPPQWAYGRLEEFFQRDAQGNTRLGCLAVSGGTNRYYTLQPLQLLDTVVRAVVSDEFTLGPDVRNWLDDDEFVIRSRIHRDLTQVLRTLSVG